MRIQESDIRLASWHEQEEEHAVETRGQSSFRQIFQTLAGSESVEGKSGESEQERVVRLLQSLVDAILAALQGKKCRTASADGKALPETGTSVRRGEGAVEWHWETTERIREHERTQVEGSGSVRTADGKTIDFKLGLDLCRDYSCERTASDSGRVVLHDPLVLNFDGKAAELKGERFAFDLDSDGQVEWIPGLGEGSSFLALDRNGNGQVDNGSELFGAGTGNGFADLAKLDSDGNGWLDEADPGFADLRLWSGNKGEKDLASLADKGIGALWLGATDSPFALKDSTNQILGEIRASSLYLTEDGRAGSLQQVDLAVAPAGPESPSA